MTLNIALTTHWLEVIEYHWKGDSRNRFLYTN